jgi:hypothetical protein
MVVGQDEFAWTPANPIGVNRQEGPIGSMLILQIIAVPALPH